jgi:hypothetical protein
MPSRFCAARHGAHGAALVLRSSIGTIITQISSPTGRLTRANSSAPTAATCRGATCPSAMPAAMASATQTVR